MGNQGPVNISRNALSHRPDAAPAPLGDWQELCRIIMSRLRLTGNEWLAATPAEDVEYTSRRIEASIRECASALQQLRQALVDEVGRRRALERQLLTARAALSRVHALRTDLVDGEAAPRCRSARKCLGLLPRRQLFLERLELALTEMEPPRQALAVLFMKVHHLRPLNDADAGGELLGVVAARLARGKRADTTASHLGGDEFACLMSGLPNREHAREEARRLVDVLSAPVTVGGLEIRPQPHIGIAMCPEDGYTADALLNNAATAMGRAERQNVRFAFSRVPTLY
jgi:diguanylate cyclase (GGDEF)-like protein